MFPLRDYFYHRKWTYRLKNIANGQEIIEIHKKEKSVITEHFDQFKLDKMPITREILSKFQLGRKASQVILVVFLDRK